MKKQLLIDMLKLAYENQGSKHILNLYIQIESDVSLPDDVSSNNFSNEFYGVRDIRWIRQCINFIIM